MEIREEGGDLGSESHKWEGAAQLIQGKPQAKQLYVSEQGDIWNVAVNNLHTNGSLTP